MSIAQIIAGMLYVAACDQVYQPNSHGLARFDLLVCATTGAASLEEAARYGCDR